MSALFNNCFPISMKMQVKYNTVLLIVTKSPKFDLAGIWNMFFSVVSASEIETLSTIKRFYKNKTK